LVLDPLPTNPLILTVPCFVDLGNRARRRHSHNRPNFPFCQSKSAPHKSHGVEYSAHIRVCSCTEIVHIYFWHLRRILTLNLNIPRRILRMYLHRRPGKRGWRDRQRSTVLPCRWCEAAEYVAAKTEEEHVSFVFDGVRCFEKQGVGAGATARVGACAVVLPEGYTRIARGAICTRWGVGIGCFD
jgi:hypothetical protein